MALGSILESSNGSMTCGIGASLESVSTADLYGNLIAGVGSASEGESDSMGGIG